MGSRGPGTQKHLLLLDFVELVNLVGQFIDGILLLLTQSNRVLLTLDGGLLEVTAQLLQLSLTLLVKVNLEGVEYS